MASSSPAPAPWYLYIVECDDGRLYTGITNDLAARFATHGKGKGSFFTRVNRPMRYVACREYPSRSIAAKAEALLKKQSRAFKVAWSLANPPAPEIAMLCGPSTVAAARFADARRRRPPQPQAAEPERDQSA